MGNENLGSEEQKAAFMGSVVRSQTMADSALRVTIDLAPADAVSAFTAFGSPGSPVAVARLSNQAAVEADRPGKEPVPVKPWGQEAKGLYQSSFFRNPKVWEAIGTNEEYLQWVKRQPSAYSGDYSEWHDDGSKYCVPAHVRRVNTGAGTAWKPPYSAIPLTDEEHKRAHQHGDSALGNEEWWSQKRIQYLHAWCWETAKAQIQEQHPSIDCSSWGCIPPTVVSNWAANLRIEVYLPEAYRGYHSEDTQSSSAREA